MHVFRSLLTGVALLGLATAIACVTTSDPVERTLTGTFVSCIVLAAIAYKEVLFSLRSMSFGSNTYDARKVDATSASLVLSSVQQQEFDNFQRRFLVVQLLATFVDFLQGPYLYRLYENYNYDMVGTKAIEQWNAAHCYFDQILSLFLLDRYLTHACALFLPPPVERHRDPVPARFLLLRPLLPLRGNPRRHVRPAPWMHDLCRPPDRLMPPASLSLLRAPGHGPRALGHCHVLLVDLL